MENMIPERLNICKTIADRMKLSRRKERITQKQLAEKIGVAEISIKRWEMQTLKECLMSLS